MLRQPRYDPYEESAFFADGRVMQWPAAGTVPTSRELGEPGLVQGFVADTYLREVPVPVNDELLASGQKHFDIYCQPCHGVLGDAKSVVGSNMPLVTPRNLLSEQIRNYPPGRIFRVATEGYGVMPPYTMQMSTEERWAVVTYVQALQLARGVDIARLPAALQSAARGALR